MNIFVKAALLVMAAMSLITFLLYGIDKRRARKSRWRISEKALLICALAMGASGALAGMKVFRHKTRKWKFRILVPLCLVINITLVCVLWRFG